jgi:hypothetical protein
VNRYLSFFRERFGALRNELSTKTSGVSLDAFSHYVNTARSLGVDRPYLFLSFDCDTDLDAEAAEQVHEFLDDFGIKATYAVPGAQLLRSPEPYRRLADRGAEFINHGGLPHTEWRGDHWAGITFYETMSFEEVEADIRQGHEIVSQVIGRSPLGFRAPHFGCFQKPDQVELMHRTAASLGYTYCSTTLPSFGLRHGPAFCAHGLIELSCFGSARNPETILDSWTYLSDRKNYTLDEQYLNLMVETVDVFLSQNMPAVFTWYADPCHVLNQRPFVRAMEHLASAGVVSVSGAELCNLIRTGVGSRFYRSDTIAEHGGNDVR